MSDDDESSQEGGEMLGVVGGGLESMAGVDASDKAVSSGTAGSGGGVSMQMLQAYAARKRVKSSGASGGKSSKSGGGRLSSSSRTRPVVKLLVTSVSRSYSEPWRRRQQRESSGTGFLIRWGNNINFIDGESTTVDGSCTSKENNNNNNKPVDSIRIVTNAHVVRNASTVRARASFGPHVVSCEVEWLSLPLDLALLKIAEGDMDEFCKGWNIEEMLSTSATDIDVLETLVKSSEEEGEVKNKKKGSMVVNIDPPSSDVSVVVGSNNNDDKSTQQKRSKSKNSNSICLTLSSGLPRLDENVTCVGFPTGGTQISVTRGVVSRIDVDGHSILRIQIDAAINPGNSGGPVFDERGHVVGIASAHLRGAGNIGYIIPSKIVAMFLQMCIDGVEVDTEDRFSGLGTLVVRNEGENENEPKHVPGIPNLATQGSQNLESKALRRHLGLEALNISGGVRIVGAVGSVAGQKRKQEDAPEEGDVKSESTSTNESNNDGTKKEDERTENGDDDRLQGDDVLLAINGCPIGMDGTIQLSDTRPDERINYRSLVTCQTVGSKVNLDVLRKKQRKQLEVMLDMSRFLVSQYDDFDALPLYCVVGGCVFSPLTLPLVQEKKTKSPSSFSRFYRDQRSGNEQIIVLSKVLNDDVNVGYHGWKNLVLKSVNGYEPTNIQDLVGVLARKMHSEMIEFRCTVVGQDDADYVICMDLKEVLKSEQRVLKQHMIASWCSMDAMSKELREEVEKYEPSEANRIVSFNSLKDMRAILERKEEN